MANLQSKGESTRITAEIEMLVGKHGVVESWVSDWIADTLLTQAKREGWEPILSIKITILELESN